MATAKFEVTLNQMSGATKVKVAVGTTVRAFKSANGISSSVKLIGATQGTLAESAILTDSEVWVSTSKQNG